MGFWGTIKSSWARAQEKRKTLSKPLQVLTSLKTTAILGTVLGTLLSPATALRSVKEVARFVAPKTLTRAGIYTVGAGALVASPSLRKAAKETPKTLYRAGKAIGEKVEELPKEKKEKASKYGTAGLVVAGVGAGIVGAVAVKEKVIGAKEKVFGGEKKLKEVAPEKQLVTEKPVGIQGEVPITPKTTTITTGKTPSKRRRAKKTPSVRQSVRININARATGIRATNRRSIYVAH